MAVVTSVHFQPDFYTLLRVSNRSLLQVVTRSSAVLNLPNETARELNANHQSICRYKDRSDQNWRPVLNSILGMVSFTARQSPRPSRFSTRSNEHVPADRHSAPAFRLWKPKTTATPVSAELSISTASRQLLWKYGV